MEQQFLPSGLTRRGRRLTDAETRDRMLRAAIGMINREGLTVSLEHISFEAVIRAAEVSRSSAYRHWRYKDQFFGDVVKELARTAATPLVRDEIGLLKQVLADRVDWLATPRGRHDLVVEAIRHLAHFDLHAVLASPAWRTYHALCATVAGLADGDLRGQIQAALADSERARIARIASAWQAVAEIFGYRVRPELNAGFDALAALLSVSMHGLIITEIAAPEIAGQETVARPFGAPADQRWSLSALSLASVAMTFLEPDPDAAWRDLQLAHLYEAIDAIAVHNG